MIVTIHQPDFMPWLGFFERWSYSDLFIVLDDVQFIRRGWQNRDKIPGNSETQWLTVPVKSKGQFFQKINEVQVNEANNWQKDHLNTLTHIYGSAPNFDKIIKIIKTIYERDYTKLIDLNMHILRAFAEQLEIMTPCAFSSNYKVEGSSTDKLVNLVKAAGGNCYLTGQGSKTYLDECKFVNNGISVEWQEFEISNYHFPGFKANKELSTIDFLMNCLSERTSPIQGGI